MRKPGVQEAGRPERHDGFLKPKDFQDLLDSWFPFLMDSNLVPLMRLLEKCKIWVYHLAPNALSSRLNVRNS